MSDASGSIVIVTRSGIVIGPFDNAEQADAFAHREGFEGHEVRTMLSPFSTAVVRRCEP